MKVIIKNNNNEHHRRFSTSVNRTSELWKHICTLMHYDTWQESETSWFMLGLKYPNPWKQ